MLWALLLIIPGFIITFIGYIMFIVAAFRASVGWGIACLILQPAQFIFMFTHWDEVSRAFWTQLGGVGLVVLGFFIGFPTPEGGKFGSDAEAVQGMFDAFEEAAESVTAESVADDTDEMGSDVSSVVGLSEIEVRKALGNPPRTLESGDETYWWYDTRQITFKDGVAIEDGPEGQ